MIDRDSIESLVRIFYRDVRSDATLAPVFAAVLGEDWGEHQIRLVEFWSTLLLGTRSYSGSLLSKHAVLEGLAPVHFLRWLALWFEHTASLFEPQCAAQLQSTAMGIARSLYRSRLGHPAGFDAIESEFRQT